MRYFVAGWVAAAAVVAGVLVVIGAPGFVERQYNGFVEGNYTIAENQRLRLLNPGNNGRLFHWRVAYDRFRAEPLHGDGAGTYETAWDRYRPTGFDVLDAHSLYVEVMGELGLVGLALLLIALLTILFGFLRLARGSERGPPAALFAAGADLGAARGHRLGLGADRDRRLAVRRRRDLPRGAGRRDEAARARSRHAHRARLGCLVLALTPFQVLRSQAALDDAARRVRGARLPADDRQRAGLAERDAIAAGAVPAARLLRHAARPARPRHPQHGAGDRARSATSWQTWYGLAFARGAAGRIRARRRAARSSSTRSTRLPPRRSRPSRRRGRASGGGARSNCGSGE